MRFSSSRSTRTLTLGAILVATTVVHGQTSTWRGATGGSWFTSTNWTGGTPSSSRDAVVNLNRTVTIGSAGARARSLEIDNSGTVSLSGPAATLIVNSWANIGYSGQGTLSLTGGATATIGSIDSGIDESASGTILVDGAGSKLTTNGTDYLGFYGGSTVTISNGGHYETLGGDLILGYQNTTTGTTLTVTGAGSKLTSPQWLTVGNFGKAGMVVSAGATVSSGTASLAYGVSDGTAGSIQGSATVTGAGSRWEIDGTLGIGTYGDATEYTIGSVTIDDGGIVQVGATGDGTVHLQRESTLRIGNGGTAGTLHAGEIQTSGSIVFDHSDSVTFSIPLADDPYLGSGGTLTKTGSGTLTLAVSNTGFNGTTTVTGGTLAIGANNRLGATPESAKAGALTLDGGTLQTTASFTLSANRGIVLGAAGGALETNTGTTLTYSGVIAGAGSLTKTGSGQLTLSGDNSFSGGLRIAQGTLRAQSNTAALGVGTVTLSGGNLQLAGTNLAFNRNTTVTANATITADRTSGSSQSSTHTMGTLSIGGSTLTISRGSNITGSGNGGVVFGATTLSGNTTFSPGANAALTLGALSDGGSARTITKTGAGSLTLATAAASFANDSTFAIQAGSLALNHSSALGARSRVTLSTGATLSLGASPVLGALDGAGGTVNLGSNTLTVGNAANNLSSSFGGVISGNGSLVKAGTGTLTLSGANSYSGTTSVQGGKLVVNGSATSSAFTVNAGASLGGNGSIGALTVAEDGILSPGNSPGTLHARNTLWEGGGVYLWEISRATGDPGSQWDLLSVNGVLTLGSTSDNPFTIAIASLDLDGDAGAASNFDPAQTYTWIIASASNGIAGFDAARFSIDATGFANAPHSSRFTLGSDGTNLTLTYSAVPEPGAWGVLGALGLLVIAVQRRRR